MIQLQDLIQITSGSPQFRITESLSEASNSYYFYGQQEIENDLVGFELNKEDAKLIRTDDKVNTLNAGDVVFSLISGRSTIVQAKHQGFLFTQNYMKLDTMKRIDKRYLVYLLNESDFVKKQWSSGLQGSAVLKHTVKQLRELELPELHPLPKQEIIGNIYFEQLRLDALKKRVAENEKLIMINRLKEVR